MARRMAPDDRPPGGARRGVLLGWLIAALAIALFALIVGRPADGRPTQSPAALQPQPIAFGTGLDPATGEASDRTDRFRAGDLFAYSLVPSRPILDESVTVEVLRVEDGGLVSLRTAELPADGVIAEAVTTDAMLAVHGAGEFVLRIYVDPDEVLGEGRFTLLESPETT